MVFQLVVVIMIPIFLGIVTISPFEDLIEEEPIEDESAKIAPIEPQSDFGFLYFILFAIWFLMVIRILYKLKRGTFKIRAKF